MRHETGSEDLDRVYNRVGKISSRHNCLEAALIEMWLALFPVHQQESQKLSSSWRFSKFTKKLEEKASKHEALNNVSISKIYDLVEKAKNLAKQRNKLIHAEEITSIELGDTASPEWDFDQIKGFIEFHKEAKILDSSIESLDDLITSYDRVIGDFNEARIEILRSLQNTPGYRNLGL